MDSIPPHRVQGRAIQGDYRCTKQATFTPNHPSHLCYKQGYKAVLPFLRFLKSCPFSVHLPVALWIDSLRCHVPVLIADALTLFWRTLRGQRWNCTTSTHIPSVTCHYLSIRQLIQSQVSTVEHVVFAQVDHSGISAWPAYCCECDAIRPTARKNAYSIHKCRLFEINQ